MSNVYEICFTGQIDSISPEDVDFILQIEVTDVVNTEGNFSRQAETPEEFYGEKYLEWELLHVGGVGECYNTHGERYEAYYHLASREQLQAIADTYKNKIEELLWEAIDEERDEEYIDAHEPRYLEE